MVLDFVALRDIQIDEEILIDYGTEWEAAWEKHVAEFVSPCVAGMQQSSKFVQSMNDDKFNREYHYWTDDHFMLCKDDHTQWRKVTDIAPGDDLFDLHLSDDHEGFKLDRAPSSWHPCLILDSFPDHQTFDVVSFSKSQAAVDHGSPLLRRNHNLGADHVEFKNKPFKSDMFWQGAFRHAIKIPDDVFPLQWRDLAEVE